MFINWNVTTRFDPNSLQPSTHGIPVPSYGKYGGPNYSAGIEGGTTPETPTNPAPVDALDFLFWQHDLVYQHVQEGAAPPTTIAQADVHLVEGMYGLTQTDFFNNNPEALLYDALGTLTIVGKILTSPEEFAYFQTLSPSEQYLLGVLAPQEAVQNFEIGLAETPGNEARSLHGAFHVFEAHFAANIGGAVAGAYGALNDAGQITATYFDPSLANSFLADPNPTATPDRANVIFSQTLSVDAAHGVLVNDIGSLLSVTTVNGQAANVGQSVAGVYGTLTLNADGSYSYLATGQASTHSGVGLDVFTYTAGEANSSIPVTFSDATATFYETFGGTWLPSQMIDGIIHTGDNGWSIYRDNGQSDGTLSETALLTLASPVAAGSHSWTITINQDFVGGGEGAHLLGDFSLGYTTDPSPNLSNVFTPFTVTAATSLNGSTLTSLGNGQLLDSGVLPIADVYTITLTSDSPDPITGIFLNAINDPTNGLPSGGPGRFPGNFGGPVGQGNFVISELTAEVSANTNTTTLTFVDTQTDQTYLGGTEGVTINGPNGHAAVLDGGAGNDVVVAGTGATVLIGGPGDTLTGTKAADTFLFAPNFGENTITNFNFHNDTLELPKSEFGDLATVLADAYQNGTDTVIAHDAQDIITLHNVTLSQLHDSHILLV